MGGESTLRGDARALVKAAAAFDRGIDRRFLDIMRDFLNGSIDRAGVVAKFTSLFGESSVAPAEGGAMLTAFQTIRSRAQAQ
jgi:hypothetical protein